MSTAPKMKPAKAAGKLNLLPAVMGVPSGTVHKLAPERPPEDDLIRKALEAAGFKMTGDPIWLGGHWFAGIHSPTTISTNGSRRIRKSLESAGFKMTGDPIPLGGKLFVGIHSRSWNKEAPVFNPSLSPHVAANISTPEVNAKKRSDDSNLLAARVAKKLDDPAGNPTMTVEQVSFAFSVSKQTIYRWIDKGLKQGPDRVQLTWAAHGKIRTELVRRALGLT